MKSILDFIAGLFKLAILGGIAVAVWQVVRHWHAGQAENAGHVLDASMKNAAKKLEETAVVLETWAGGGHTENLGKSLDEVLMHTKESLDKASAHVLHALSEVR